MRFILPHPTEGVVTCKDRRGPERFQGMLREHKEFYRVDMRGMQNEAKGGPLNFATPNTTKNQKLYQKTKL